MLGQSLADPRRPVHQFTAAIGAAVIQRLRAGRAEGTFEGTDERPRFVGRQRYPAALAVKMTLGSLLLVALAVALTARRDRSASSVVTNHHGERTLYK